MILANLAIYLFVRYTRNRVLVSLNACQIYANANLAYEIRCVIVTILQIIPLRTSYYFQICLQIENFLEISRI